MNFIIKFKTLLHFSLTLSIVMNISNGHSDKQELKNTDIGTIQNKLFSSVNTFYKSVRCHEIDIRNNLKDDNALKMIKYLRNCTVIEGSLTIVLIEQNDEADFLELEFPLLKEITGYFVVASVYRLTYLGKMFPNLAIIRGKELIGNYAFILYDLIDLKEIGLESLIAIQRGFVAILNCASLCFSNTIDWKVITADDESGTIGTGNILPKNVSATCPISVACRNCKHCWSYDMCQKFNTITGKDKKGINITCHAQCLGGCTDSTARGCHYCLHLSVNGTCVDKCDDVTFLHPISNRCVSEKDCLRDQLIPFQGECRQSCPAGYSNINYSNQTTAFSRYQCFPCYHKCEKTCSGTSIEYIAETDHYYGCEIILVGLHLSIKAFVGDTQKRLERNFGAVKEIKGPLKVTHSFGIKSLSFFKSLTVISPPENTFLFVDRYALMITENPNLQTLFNWQEKPSFTITRGSITFHYNNKLCLNEIHTFQRITKYNNINDTIGYETNGYEESCLSAHIRSKAIVHNHQNVTIFWQHFNTDTRYTILGYLIYYVATLEENVTYYSGVDACSNLSWYSIFITSNDLVLDVNDYTTNLTNLEPYTKYAYYIKTQITWTDQDEMINVTQGQSTIQYFKTYPDKPDAPIVRTQSKTNTSITLEWHTSQNQFIEQFYIDVYSHPEQDQLDQRNFCKYPLEPLKPRPIELQRTIECNCSKQGQPNHITNTTYLKYFESKQEMDGCEKDEINCKQTSERFRRNIEKMMNNVSVDHKDTKHTHYDESDNVNLFLLTKKVPELNNLSPIKRDIKDKYYMYTYVINDSISSGFTLEKLLPFTLYTFHVSVCNHLTNCSSYFFHTDRTEVSSYADEIKINIESDLADPSSLIVDVLEPEIINGLIVAYEIEYQLSDVEVTNLKCIPRNIHSANKSRYQIKDLKYGKYYVRGRAVSLASKGKFTSYVTVYIGHNDKSLVVIISSIGFLFIIIGIIVVIYFVLNKYRNLLPSAAQDIDTRVLLSDVELLNMDEIYHEETEEAMQVRFLAGQEDDEEEAAYFLPRSPNVA